MTRDYAVVIPTYNRYQDCLRAIRSALTQTAPPLEVVVIDDGSDDERYQWLEEIVDDSRLSYLRLAHNTRQRLHVAYAIGAVRNIALQYLDVLHFDGWIAFLDDDDEWLPEKCQRQFEAVEALGNCRLIGTNATNRSPAGELLGTHHGQHGQHLGGNVYDVTRAIGRENPVINSTAMITTALRQKIGLQQATTAWEDHDFWRRAAAHTRVLRVNDPLVYYTTGNEKSYQV